MTKCLGHTRSWAYSHPELFAKCYETDYDSPYYGGLDPTKEETLDLLVKFFKEIIELFPESYLHMGFDEVEFSCLWVFLWINSLLPTFNGWIVLLCFRETNPHIQNYLSDHQLQTSIDAIKLFTVKLLNSIQAFAKKSSMTGGRKFIFWQEAFESGLKVLWFSVYNAFLCLAAQQFRDSPMERFILDTWIFWLPVYYF